MEAQAALDICGALQAARVTSSPHITQTLGGRAIRGGIPLGSRRALRNALAAEPFARKPILESSV